MCEALASCPAGRMLVLRPGFSESQLKLIIHEIRKKTNMSWFCRCLPSKTTIPRQRRFQETNISAEHKRVHVHSTSQQRRLQIQSGRQGNQCSTTYWIYPTQLAKASSCKCRQYLFWYLGEWSSTLRGGSRRKFRPMDVMSCRCELDIPSVNEERTRNTRTERN